MKKKCNKCRFCATNGYCTEYEFTPYDEHAERCYRYERRVQCLARCTFERDASEFYFLPVLFVNKDNEGLYIGFNILCWAFGVIFYNKKLNNSIL